MNKHSKIMMYFNQMISNTPLKELCDNVENEQQLCRLLFQNYRQSSVNETNGMRLTNQGLTLMKLCFKHWSIAMEKGYQPKSLHLLYFDRKATMPWYIDNKVLVLFESELALKAKLVGNMDLLMNAFEPL